MLVARPFAAALALVATLSVAPPAPAARTPGAPTTHTVYAGQTLGRIAKRYHVTVEAIRRANGLRTGSIRPGQKLAIPGEGDDSPPEVRPRARGVVERWQDYAEKPRRRGYVVLESPTKRWRGIVLSPRGKILPKAREGIERMFASWRTGSRHEIDPRLVQLVVRLSDTFGGRTIRVVSGYRERSFAVESKHKVGRAFDFSIPGVPNGIVRDYLRTLTRVGVGYYPNSTHVHVDVREATAYWVDAAGPGEPPKLAGRRAPSIEDASCEVEADPEEPAEPPDEASGAPEPETPPALQ